MTSIPCPSFDYNVGAELERLQGLNPIRGAPVFVIDPPCRNQSKEWRRERWRDWQEANGRSTGGFGTNRNLQFAYLREAAEARKGPVEFRKVRVELYASCSKVERLKNPALSPSPMALIEGRK